MGRQVSLTPKDDVSGAWTISSPETVKDFSAVAYFFGRKIYEAIQVPIGLINSSYGASSVEAWMDEQSLLEIKTIDLTKEIPKERPQQSPTLLYNGMLHPLQGYTIKGFIWYQGEGNRLNAEEYYDLFSAMIKQWRNQWEQGDLPFYFVQIAPFNYGNGKAALVREAQLKTMQTIKNSGMVVTLDIGKCDFIHPPDKRLAGERLAYWALAKTYGIEGITYSGPVFRNMKISRKGKVTLYFDYSRNGLTTFGKTLTGFEVAGEDKIFHKAMAELKDGKTVVVFSGAVKKPYAVRYAFGNCPSGTLFNKEGLPASPFSTKE